MNQDYIKNLLGPTTAESQVMAYNPEREFLKAMVKSGDPVAVRQGMERLGGGGDPANVAEYKYHSRLSPGEKEQYSCLSIWR